MKRKLWNVINDMCEAHYRYSCDGYMARRADQNSK